ncbi:hypothetical protein AB0K24_34040, partial [Streptomyces mirabilis]
ATSTPPTSPPGPTILDWDGWGIAPRGYDYQMPTMTKEETASYIKHHLTIAGRSDPLFPTTPSA